MPKLFPIHIEVEEVALGRVMRILHHTEGVAKIDLQMEEPAPRPKLKKPNGHAPHAVRDKFEIKGTDFVIEMLDKANGPIRHNAIRQAFVNKGRAPGSANYCLYGLAQEGLVQSTKEGYVLTKKMKDRLYHKRHK